ncbi:hypothetical protein [Erythrobacter sp. F6033]|uniref:hypothetical protein n=1 Tax=Erythrobacter sp. F6033 TaxID=2926401 RepID=UPI001FF5025E|nr:hypothetical protein [Erythrobacter sp. F6033]MCK0127284.1 hypothetical protein [Erythrobacter sp. F6033]
MCTRANARTCTNRLTFNRPLDNAATTLFRARQFASARFDVARLFNVSWSFNILRTLDVTRLSDRNAFAAILYQLTIKIGRVLGLVGVKRLGHADGTTLDQGDTRDGGGELCSSQFERHSFEPCFLMVSDTAHPHLHQFQVCHAERLAVLAMRLTMNKRR